MSALAYKRTILVILAFVAVMATLIVLVRGIDNHLDIIETQLQTPAPTTPSLEKVMASPVVAAGETVHVPVYPHIYASGGRKVGLEATLSIRNADLDLAIIINSLRCYSTDGRMLREYLETPVRLEPMASTDFLVERRDVAGGESASCLVDWVAEDLVTEPIIEAVMVRFEGTKALSFVRSGRPTASVQADE